MRCVSSSLAVIRLMCPVTRVVSGIRGSFFMNCPARFSIFIRFLTVKRVWSFLRYSSALRG